MTDLIALAKQAGMVESVNSPIMLLCGLSTLQDFADLIRKDEREQCAVLMEEQDTQAPKYNARAIRARTTT